MNRYRALSPYLKKGDRILDAGAGGGEVVYVLRRFGCDASGIEPDEHYAQHARDVLAVPVRTGFVQDQSFPPGSFDVITMYHALEHVEDPSAILSQLRAWIVANGTLYIEVPSVEARCIAPSHRFHFAHFYNFNHTTLESLGRKAGFEPMQTSTSPDGGNLIGVFKAVPRDVAVRTDPENYARIAATVQRHTSLKYYCSRYPYVGPLGRLRAYLTDRRAITNCATPTQVLDKVIDAAAVMERNI